MPSLFPNLRQPLHNSFIFGSIPTLKDALSLHLPLLSQGHQHHPLQSYTPSRNVEVRERERELLQTEISKLANTTRMAKSLPPYDQLVEEDYIDIDISSSTTFLCYSISSPPHSREFEFQMSTHPPERETTPSPADELFYKGKLLPLHLPPRLQMVQMLLQSNSNNAHRESIDLFEENMSTTASNTTTNTTATTPFESCNISPSNSCYVSGELNPEEHFYECSAGLMQPHSKKSWSKKLKSIKKSSLGLKLKASRAYIKSLFSKSGCSDESCAILKVNECSNGYQKAEKKNPFEQIKREIYPVADINANTIARSIGEEKLIEDDCSYRRSFSGVIKWHTTSKSSSACSSCSSCSSFSSGNSRGLYMPQMLKRSNSVNSEVESSIQGAIAYCKKSQQPVPSARKSVSDVGFCSLSASRIAAACEKKEKPGLCRG